MNQSINEPSVSRTAHPLLKILPEHSEHHTKEHEDHERNFEA